MSRLQSGVGRSTVRPHHAGAAPTSDSTSGGPWISRWDGLQRRTYNMDQTGVLQLQSFTVAVAVHILSADLQQADIKLQRFKRLL